MIIQTILFLILSTGGVFCAAVFKRRYEELLPITCSSIVVILFLFGIFGILLIGVYAVCALCLALFVFSCVWVIRKKTFKSFLQNIFTPAFFLFCALFAILSFLNRGKLASSWDEFSHWADIVKVMTTLDDFGTNPNSFSAFQNYPPAMSLFQYFFQKINALVSPSFPFSEWRMYFAYQIFFISFFFPFFGGFDFRRPIIQFVSIIATCAAPLLFYSDAYTSIYIDAFLGILSAVGLARCYLCRKKDAFYCVNILLIMFVLILSKDSGLLFAIFLAIAFWFDFVFFQQPRTKERAAEKIKQASLLLLGSISMIVIPKFLWTLNVKLNHAREQFTGKIDLHEFLRIFLYRDPSSYRTSVLQNFNDAFITRHHSVGSSSIAFSYIIWLALLMIGLFYLFHINRPKKKVSNHKVMFWIILVQCCTYILGLCILYMFKFSDYEAVRLASFERYINTAFVSVWMIIVLLAVDFIQQLSPKQNIAAALLLGVTMVCTPWPNVASFLDRSAVVNSIAIRQPYESVISSFKQFDKPQEEKIWVISQEDKGLDFWIMRYSMRPNRVDNSWAWSIGEPFYDGDIWTRSINAQEWQNLLAEGYDYVILYNINDYFVESFATVFAHPEDIQKNAIYRFNKKTMMLEICR